MDPTIVVAIISAIEGFGIAVIGLIVSSINKKNEQYRKARDAREAERQAKRDEEKELLEEYELAKLELIFATANGTDVLLKAAHGDHLNGNVQEAMDSISRAKSECNHVVNKRAAKRRSFK